MHDPAEPDGTEDWPHDPFTCPECQPASADDDLLGAARFAYDVLCDMTTEAFSLGADRPIRERLAVAIAHAEGRIFDESAL